MINGEYFFFQSTFALPACTSLSVLLQGMILILPCFLIMIESVQRTASEDPGDIPLKVSRMYRVCFDSWGQCLRDFNEET